MKCCTQVFTAIALLSIVSCDTFNTPLNTSGDFDPLRTAGGGASGPNLATGPTYRAGQFVRAALDNTAFYKSKPRGEANADQLLKRGTSMKVVSSGSSYLKVELDSGDIGFVPVVMIEDSSSAPQSTSASSREVQVYPPLPGSFDSGPIQPLPPSDPAGAPPEGAIPTVIDPEAPAASATPPVVTPTTEKFPAPAPVESAPLPPNDEEIAAGKVEATTPPAPAEKPVEKPAGQ